MQLTPITENVNIQTELGFNNTINRNDKSAEQRIVEHKNPIRKFTFFKNIITATEIQTIRNFHFSVKGSKEAFLYQDKSDHSANFSGTYSYGCLYPNANGSIKDFQLCKFYFVANNNHYRAITQPIADTLTLKQGANTLTGWTLQDNGKITFTNAPNSGLIVAQFNFNVPVRFDSDKFEDKIIVRYNDNQKIYSLEKLTFTEIKITPYLDPDDTINLTINHTFHLDLYKNAITTAQYETEIESQSSGFEERKTRQQDPLFLFKLQERRTLQQKDIDYLIALYLCSKGEGCEFQFEDKSTNEIYPARFNNASLNYINQSANRVYQIQGLELRIFFEGIKTDNGYNGWQGNLLTLCHIFEINFEEKAEISYQCNKTYSIDLEWQGFNDFYTGQNGSGTIYNHVFTGILLGFSKVSSSGSGLGVNCSWGGYYPGWGSHLQNCEGTTFCQYLNKNEGGFVGAYQTFSATVIAVRVLENGVWIPLEKTQEGYYFTTHDRDLTIDGKVYRSDKTLSPSALETKVDLSTDNQEIRGILSIDIPEETIFANRFKDAELITAVVDWRNLPGNLEAIPDRDIQHGVIGEVRTNGNFFIFEYLTKAASLLRAGRIRTVTPNCPYEFTDNDCKVDPDSVTYETTVGAVQNRRSFAINQVESNLAFGTVKFLSGANKGIKATIYEIVDTNKIVLYTLLPYLPQSGDRIEIKKGCRKIPEVCKGYDNFINYGGDEDLPGNDFYLSTPIVKR